MKPLIYNVPIKAFDVPTGLSVTDGFQDLWSPSPIHSNPAFPQVITGDENFPYQGNSDHLQCNELEHADDVTMAGVGGFACGAFSVLTAGLVGYRFYKSLFHTVSVTTVGKKSSETNDENSSKEAKRSLYQIATEPLDRETLIQEFQKRFPDANFVIRGVDDSGNLQFERGILIFNPDNPLQLLAVPSNQFIASAFHYADDRKVFQVDFGGVTGVGHIKEWTVSRRRPEDQKIYDRVMETLLDPNTDLQKVFREDRLAVKEGRFDDQKLFGALSVGFERETWVIDPKTGDLVTQMVVDAKTGKMALFQGEELLLGQDEIDEGFFISHLQAMVGMAQWQKKLEALYEGYYLNNTSVPLSGSLESMRVNTFDLPERGKKNMGPYVAIVERYNFPRYQPTTDDSLAIRNAQARKEGYDDAQSMIESHGDCRSWCASAAHMNLGVINFKNDGYTAFRTVFDETNNLSSMAMSEFGAIPRMLAGSSAMFTDISPRVRGQVPTDYREFMRKDMGTALSHNRPVRDEKHLIEILQSTMTYSGEQLKTANRALSDRLARAVVAHTTDDGNYIATAHGAGRWRFENSGRPDGRIEYTGAATTSILPKARSMAISQLFQFLATEATHANKDIFTHLEDKYGFSRDVVWGSADAAVEESFLFGNRSEGTLRIRENLARLFEKIDAPALALEKATALATLNFGMDGSSFEDLAKGRGTLGGAIKSLVDTGDYTGIQLAKIVHVFMSKEADYILSIQNDELALSRYASGQAGFEFDVQAALAE